MNDESNDNVILLTSIAYSNVTIIIDCLLRYVLYLSSIKSFLGRLLMLLSKLNNDSTKESLWACRWNIMPEWVQELKP